MKRILVIVAAEALASAQRPSEEHGFILKTF